MTRVLIIGGYGTFGRRIAARLARDARLHLMIGGRSLDRAESLVGELRGTARLEAVRFDRDGDLERRLDDLRPDVVVDASGPFQAYGKRPQRVAEAAIARGCHYLDIADDPDFVRGVARLDAAARRRGVFAIAGASTCPAFTGAIARHLAAGMASVSSLVGGFAPSPGVRPGAGVIAAVAAMAGRPVPMRRQGGIGHGVAFTETRVATVAPPGTVPLRRLRYSLVNVPDLTLLHEAAPGTDDVWFGAAPTPAVHHWLLRGLARLVRWRLLTSLAPLERLFGFATRRCVWGPHRGGLWLCADGRNAAGDALSCAFHLVAEGDDGPSIPGLAAVLLVTRVLDGSPPPPGARAAHRELEFDAFVPLLDDIGIRHGTRTHGPSTDGLPPFRRLLGDEFERLPAPVRALHSGTVERRYRGQANVTVGASVAARALRALFRLPRPGTAVPVAVTIAPRGATERWTRDFGGRRFVSVLSAGRGRDDGLLRERFGPVTVTIALVTVAPGLRFLVRGWRVLGLPLPTSLAPHGDIREAADGDRFRFHVEMRVPLVGHLVTYAGWLDIPDAS